MGSQNTCGKFGDCSFIRFGSIADEHFTPATVVGVSNELRSQQTSIAFQKLECHERGTVDFRFVCLCRVEQSAVCRCRVTSREHGHPVKWKLKTRLF